MVDVFKRLRVARTAEEAERLYAEAIAESPLASPTELGALRRGYVARRSQLRLMPGPLRASAGPPPLPGHAPPPAEPVVVPTAVPSRREARLTGRLAEAPSLARGRRGVSKAGISTVMVIFAVFGISRMVRTCASGKFSSNDGPSEADKLRKTMEDLRERSPLSILDRESLDEYWETQQRVEAVLEADDPNARALDDLLEELGLDEAEIDRYLKNPFIRGDERRQLRGLQRLLERRKGPP